MASVPQSPWFYSIKPNKPFGPSPNPIPIPIPIPRNCTFKTLRVSSSSSQSSSADPSSSPNNNNSSESTQTDPVKLAFEKAKAYKQSRQQQQQQQQPQPYSFIAQITQDPVSESPNSANDSNNSPESTQTDPVKLAFEKAKAYKNSRESIAQDPVSESPNSTNDSSESGQVDPVKLAFEKTMAYKKSRESITQDPVSESPNSTNDSSESTQTDPVKLAFEKAMAYKNSRQSITTQDPVSESPNSTNDSSESTQTDPVKLAFEKAMAYKNSRQSITTQAPVSESPNSTNDSSESSQIDPVKLAFVKAMKSRESNSQDPVSDSGEIGQEKAGSTNKEVPMAVKLAMERAREYKQKKGVAGGGTKIEEEGPKEEKSENRAKAPIQNRSKQKKDDPKISSIDFAGLDFADKKQGSGLPPGLVPIADPFFAGGDYPEVEIIVGDASKFGDRNALKPETNIEEEDSDVYKPKVSTWGLFPRPRNISKTYGGGKTINPGDVLETAEETEAKNNRARQLVAAYKSQVTLKIEPKLKSECEKALNDGDLLMDRGQLKEALPFYEKIMDKLPFKTDLHGFAALQWAICQDSLFRANVARVMYEKLQSHPKVQVSKKAKEFIFSFQAMEMMKVKSLDPSKASREYQNYFEAFVKDKSSTYPLLKKMEDAAQVDEGGAMTQALPYIIFLFSPLFVVLFLALKKGS